MGKLPAPGAELVAMPVGLRYQADFVTAQVAQQLLEEIDRQPWLTALKRRVQQYGYTYDYKQRRGGPEMYLGPLPSWAQGLAQHLAEQGLMPAVPDQLTVNEYHPGQGIAAHIDCLACYGPSIASLSLGCSCVMQFTQVETGVEFPLLLAPRSLVVLSGEARYGWRRGIAGRRTDCCDGRVIARGRRVSLTFRNVLGELKER
jgi:alkylated DNA repair dioxygenase AlkB